jgi:hypothetical protein
MSLSLPRFGPVFQTKKYSLFAHFGQVVFSDGRLLVRQKVKKRFDVSTHKYYLHGS